MSHRNDFICSACGYRATRLTSLLDPEAKPQPGDLTMCLNCTALYELQPDLGWHRVSDAQLASWPAADRLNIAKHAAAVRATIKADLSLDLSLRQRLGQRPRLDDMSDG